MMVVKLDSTNHVTEFHMATLRDYDTLKTTDPDWIFVDWPAFRFASKPAFFFAPSTFVYNQTQKLMLEQSS